MAKNKVYKALMVDEPTHHQVVVLAKKSKMTVDEFITYLLTLDKNNE